MPLRTPVARFALAFTSMGLSLGVPTSIAFAQLQTPVYPEGTVPGIPAPPPNPNGATPGDPGPGGMGGVPVYPGGRPSTAQPPRSDSPRSASPPAPGVNSGAGVSTGSPSPNASQLPSGPSVYQSQGSGDGRLPPSIYSRDPRDPRNSGLPSSPGSGVR